MKEAIFFCIVGLQLFVKEGSGTPVFKILVRALGWLDYNFNLHSLFHLNQNMYILFGLRENHFPCSGTGVIGRDTCIGLI